MQVTCPHCHSTKTVIADVFIDRAKSRGKESLRVHCLHGCGRGFDISLTKKEESPMDKFIEEYTKQLAIAVRDYPREYCYPGDEIPKVVERMREALAIGTYSKDGRAFKATCKVLGIPYTYKGINTYIGNS